MALTLKEACAIAHCSSNTIVKLIKSGHLAGTQQRRRWYLSTPRADIKRVVAELAPQSGWRKTATTPAKVKSDGLQSVMAFAALPGETRALLLALAERCSVEDLTALLTL